MTHGPDDTPAPVTLPSHTRSRYKSSALTNNCRGFATETELARFAQICRVRRVMQPYLDSIV